MEKNYLFIKDNRPFFDISNLKYSDIHFWNICKVLNHDLTQNIYFYCKNINELDYVLEHNFIPHLTFLGDNLFSDFYLNTLTLEQERFWFPEKKHLTQDFIDKFLSLKNIKTTPMAIVFNPIFQTNITYKEFFDFIKLLNSQYENPLFQKDLSLQDNEIFSFNNHAIIEEKQYFVTLGLFGDYYSLEKPTLQSMNFGIFKDSNCIKCEFAHSCKERGLGIIKFEEKIQSCIGIKLFQQN